MLWCFYRWAILGSEIRTRTCGPFQSVLNSTDNSVEENIFMFKMEFQILERGIGAVVLKPKPACRCEWQQGRILQPRPSPHNYAFSLLLVVLQPDQWWLPAEGPALLLHTSTSLVCGANSLWNLVQVHDSARQQFSCLLWCFPGKSIDHVAPCWNSPPSVSPELNKMYPSPGEKNSI